MAACSSGKKLTIEVIEARDIESKDLFGGLPYPYCVITCTGKDNTKLKTSIAKKTLSPIWNEIFTLDVQGLDKAEIRATVLHSRTVGSDDFIGQTAVPLTFSSSSSSSFSPPSLLLSCDPHTPRDNNSDGSTANEDSKATSTPVKPAVTTNSIDKWFILGPKDKRNKQNPSAATEGYGMIHMRFSLNDTAVTPPPSGPSPAGEAPPLSPPRQPLLLPDVHQQLRQHLKKRELERQPSDLLQEDDDDDQPNITASPRKTQRVREPITPTPVDEISLDDHNESVSPNGSHDNDPPSDSETNDTSNSKQVTTEPIKHTGGRSKKNKAKLRRQQHQRFLSQDQSQSHSQTATNGNGNDANNNVGADNNSNNNNNDAFVFNKRNRTSLPLANGSVGKSGGVNYNAITVTQVPTRELQKTFAETVSPSILQSISKEERVRQEVILELINTERDYVRDLQILIRVYIDKLRDRQLLTAQELDSLFGKIELLLPIHSNLLAHLESQQAENPVILNLGALLLVAIPHMTIYASVCSNQPSVVGKIERLSTTSSTLSGSTPPTSTAQGSLSSAKAASFKLLLEEALAVPEARSLSLMSFLIKPLQRLTRYPLLLKEILRHTDSSHPDFNNLTEVLGRLMKLVDNVNEATRRAEQELKAQEVQPLLDRGEDLRLIDKRLIREGDVKLLKMGGSGSLKKIDAHALLFDRIYYKNKSNKKRLIQQQQSPTSDVESSSSPVSYKYYTVATIPLSELMLSDGLAEKGLVALEVVYVSEAIYSVSFESPEDRHAWVIDIEQATVQHIKQQGKKDTLDLHHIELISASEAEALMFKRPLFDKDLALALLVPQNLMGTQQQSMARTGSFSSEGKVNYGSGININLNFGKSHKHKHENVEQTKLFSLERALRRDLDAFCKALRRQVLELRGGKRYLEGELQSARLATEQARQEQSILEAKIKTLETNLGAISTRTEQEGLKRASSEIKNQELESRVEIEKSKVRSLESQLDIEKANALALEAKLAEALEKLNILQVASSLCTNKVEQSTQTSDLVPAIKDDDNSPEILAKVGEETISKTDKIGLKRTAAKPNGLHRQTPSPGFKQQSGRNSRPQSSQSYTNTRQSRTLSSPPIVVAPTRKSAPSIPPKPPIPTRNSVSKPLMPVKPAVPPRPVVPPKPAVPPRPALPKQDHPTKPNIPPPRPPRAKPPSKPAPQKPPVPQRPTPPTPQKTPIKQKPAVKHPVPQKPTPPTPQRTTSSAHITPIKFHDKMAISAPNTPTSASSPSTPTSTSAINPSPTKLMRHPPPKPPQLDQTPTPATNQPSPGKLAREPPPKPPQQDQPDDSSTSQPSQSSQSQSTSSQSQPTSSQPSQPAPSQPASSQPAHPVNQPPPRTTKPPVPQRLPRPAKPPAAVHKPTKSTPVSTLFAPLTKSPRKK